MSSAMLCYDFDMNTLSNALCVNIVGAGLAGSEAALTLANLGARVRLFEMRPEVATPVHKTSLAAELVCSNSLKSTKPESAAGMLKTELSALGSNLYELALENTVAAGGALAVDRDKFAQAVTDRICSHERIELVRGEVKTLEEATSGCDAAILASGPLTSDALASSLARSTGTERLSFYDAAAPIVMADSLDMGKLFRQSRYESEGAGDYLNAPFTREEYEAFADELVRAERVIMRDFETKDLFQACQPIEEIARKGIDAPRFGTLKPVGLTDPRTGRRPWAALQLRAEDSYGASYNLVGFQTNLTFSEQKRVFRMIPGLEQAEFARFGVMHRNTFLNAPKLLNASLELALASDANVPVFVAGQLAGTEGYCEAIRSGLHAAFGVAAKLANVKAPSLPRECAFGALMAYASDPATVDYQPMHVNFGIMEPLERRIKNKRDRYAAYAARGSEALERYCGELVSCGLLSRTADEKGSLHV